MKKAIGVLLLILLFLLSSCFKGNNGESVEGTQQEDISRSGSTRANDSKDFPQNTLGFIPVEEESTIKNQGDVSRDSIANENEFSEPQIDERVINNKDIIWMIGLFNNDIDFGNEDEDDVKVFQIWRDFLFGESNLAESKVFIECLNNGNTLGLSDIYKNICEGKDEDIKNLFLLIKNAKVSKNSTQCSNLVTESYQGEVNITDTISNYLFCKKAAYGSDFDLKKNYFFFYEAMAIEKCELLKDSLLIKTCNEIKTDFKDLEADFKKLTQ